MARAYSQDLRDRVIDAANAGLPARHAAARFGIGIATAIIWVRRARETGERTARRQGQPKRSKLDRHADFLLGLINATCDITLKEMLERLRKERGVSAGIGTLWQFLNRRGLTFKKNRRTPRSKTAPTSQPRAKTGSRTSPTLSPSV